MSCYNEIMAVIEPNTEIYLLKSPIELDNDNQLSFANATAQYNYFSSLPKVSMQNATFQRKDGYIRWPASMESVLTYNYCMYRNKSYGNKWFYAFITDIQWLSNDSCGITIKTDVWQTWQFALTFKKCFVEREHVNSDTVGEHTVPEGLDLGEYICNGVTKMTVASPSSNSTIVMQVSSKNIDKDGNYQIPTISGNEAIYSGLAQGCYMIGFPYTQAGLASMYSVIGLYDSSGRGEAILAIFLVPTNCTAWQTGTITNTQISVGIPTMSTSSASGDVATIPKGQTLNGYTPKNNKMWTYPYNYLYVSNNNGSDVVFHYEDFTSNTPTFKWYATLEQGGSVYIAPTNSKKAGITDPTDGWCEGISCGKLPQLSWTSNYYLNWQAQNASNIMVQTTLDAVSWAGGTLGFMATGAIDPKSASTPSTGVIGLASSVANTMQQIKQAKMVPDQAKGNINSGSITYASGEIGYKFFNMCVRYEYAKMIDDYFTQFGYKVNSLKVPNIAGRTNWNYVRTQGCNITGDVPQTDIEEIKGLFNRGITIWHNPTTFLDYSQSNGIVS